MAESRNGGESGNGGENEPTIEELIERSSLGTPAARALRARGRETLIARAIAQDYAARVVLIISLRDAAHEGCADDLRDASEQEASQVAYDIADHVENACGNPDFQEDPVMAVQLRKWADDHDKLLGVRGAGGKKEEEGTEGTGPQGPGDGTESPAAGGPLPG